MAFWDDLTGVIKAGTEGFGVWAGYDLSKKQVKAQASQPSTVSPTAFETALLSAVKTEPAPAPVAAATNWTMIALLAVAAFAGIFMLMKFK